MFKMLNKLWLALGKFFDALHKFACATEELGAWAHESAAAVADEARRDRAKAAQAQAAKELD